MAAGPYYKPPERDDVTIGALSRLSARSNLARARTGDPARACRST